MYGIRFMNKKTGKMVARDQVGLIDRMKLGFRLIAGKQQQVDSGMQGIKKIAGVGEIPI